MAWGIRGLGGSDFTPGTGAMMKIRTPRYLTSDLSRKPSPVPGNPPIPGFRLTGSPPLLLSPAEKLPFHGSYTPDGTDGVLY